MDDQWEDVREFHKAFGHPAPDEPCFLDSDRANKRADWIVKECDELREAQNMAEQADAFIDIIYFAVGGLVEMGLRPFRLWLAVQRANMRKLWPDGKPRLNEETRVQKPPNWFGPDRDIEEEIQKQIHRAKNKTA